MTTNDALVLLGLAILLTLALCAMVRKGHTQ